MKPETACIHAARESYRFNGAVCVPIYQTSTFSRPELGQGLGYDYSREQNPTVEHTEKLIAALEGGAGASAFATGMAAIAALMELFKPGDEIIATDDLYGGSIRLFNNISAKNSVIIKYINTSDLSAVSRAVTDSTKAVFIETPTNPMMKVTDIAGVKRLIGERDILLIADNTFQTPYLFNPIAHGADIVVHSGTKFLAGHNDVLAGFLVAKLPEIAEKIHLLKKTLGGILSPFDAFLVTRGIKTLAIRMERAQSNAKIIADWLKSHPKVTDVYYPNISAMLSFKTDSVETARNVLSKVGLVLFAESLGGVETLITYPITQTHADVPESEREARGIDGRLLRLSVGIEAAEDIIADLERALA